MKTTSKHVPRIINESVASTLHRFKSETEARKKLKPGQDKPAFSKKLNQNYIYRFPHKFTGFYHSIIRRRVEACEDLSQREYITVSRMEKVRRVVVNRFRKMIESHRGKPLRNFDGVKVTDNGDFVRYYIPNWWVWVDERNFKGLEEIEGVYPVVPDVQIPSPGARRNLDVLGSGSCFGTTEEDGMDVDVEGLDEDEELRPPTYVSEISHNSEMEESDCESESDCEDEGSLFVPDGDEATDGDESQISGEDEPNDGNESQISTEDDEANDGNGSQISAEDHDDDEPLVRKRDYYGELPQFTDSEDGVAIMGEDTVNLFAKAEIAKLDSGGYLNVPMPQLHQHELHQKNNISLHQSLQPSVVNMLQDNDNEDNQSIVHHLRFNLANIIPT
ncbi:hypothetical protein HDU76_009758, partial [Blyttiomyces sp. JEL0837]